jgi:hypothetical protein
MIAYQNCILSEKRWTFQLAGRRWTREQTRVAPVSQLLLATDVIRPGLLAGHAPGHDNKASFNGVSSEFHGY